MIDSRFFKELFGISFIDHEQNVIIVEEYDKIVISMLVKCYHQLHPLAYNGSSFCRKMDD